MTPEKLKDYVETLTLIKGLLHASKNNNPVGKRLVVDFICKFVTAAHDIGQDHLNEMLLNCLKENLEAEMLERTASN